MRHILVKVPTDAVGIVGSSAMPDVSCQHLVALALVKGAVSFTDSHDAGLTHDPAIAAERAKVELAGDPALMDPAAPRGAIGTITLADGRIVEHHTRHPPGTKENPLSTEAVNAKARDLLAPVLGPDKADRLIARVNALEAVADMRELRPLLVA